MLLSYTCTEHYLDLKLLFDIGHIVEKFVRIYYDNISAIYMSTNPTESNRIQHDYIASILQLIIILCVSRLLQVI